MIKNQFPESIRRGNRVGFPLLDNENKLFLSHPPSKLSSEGEILYLGCFFAGFSYFFEFIPQMFPQIKRGS